MDSREDNSDYDKEGITLHTKNSDITKTKSESLYTELSQLQFPDNIIKNAIEIHKSMNISTKRGKNRNELKFILIYYAYKSMGMVCDKNKLGNIFGIRHPSQITKIFSKYSPGKTGYDFPDLDADPENFIEEYYKTSGISNISFENFRKFADVILSTIKKNNIHHEYYPQIIAAAIIIYYLKINGISNISLFCEKIRVSENDLSGATKLIENIYNL